MPNTSADELAAIARVGVVPHILEVVCRTTGLGFSAVARVTDAKWVACAVRDEINFGLKPGGELKLESTICHSIRQSGEIVAIDHVAVDTTYCDHPTPKMYGFQSYISVPIRLPDGQFFGTLCAIDPKPARVNTPETIGMFNLFADLIAQHLEAQDRMLASEAALATERKTAQFREQFMAVLGHDLRNPLAAIRSGADVLAHTPLCADDAKVVTIIQRSTSRMTELIDNVLDFARGRLGGGITVQRITDGCLTPTLCQVITELQTSWPERTIEQDIGIFHELSCDCARIGQLLSNLLANALTHGDPDSPVWVKAHTDGPTFELSVTNFGPTIPTRVMDSLFQPFSRDTAKPGQQGLGLGLYIASEIAAAHGGTLTAASVNGETRFTFRMPV